MNALRPPSGPPRDWSHLQDPRGIEAIFRTPEGLKPSSGPPKDWGRIQDPRGILRSSHVSQKSMSNFLNIIMALFDTQIIHHAAISQWNTNTKRHKIRDRVLKCIYIYNIYIIISHYYKLASYILAYVIFPANIFVNNVCTSITNTYTLIIFQATRPLSQGASIIWKDTHLYTVQCTPITICLASLICWPCFKPMSS